MACSLVGGEGLCSLGVCDGCAKCDAKPMKVSVKVGEYFVTPWNFTRLYFQWYCQKGDRLIPVCLEETS